MNNEWSIKDSINLYNIKNWANGHFDISTTGNLVVTPPNNNIPIDISKVVEEMKLQNVGLPAVIRFHDILRSEVKAINEVFNSVIQEAEYNGKYMGVFPIKVNQMREVIEEIIEAGAEYNYGLEAGSKAELLSVLAYNDNENSLTILNGYKDEDYLRLALIGKKLGRKAIIVIEKYSELEKMLQLSQEMQVKPIIGIRSRMAVEGKGRWAHSSGDNAKFGLTVAEILKVVARLKEEKLEDCLQLFHFHMGSQISDIRTLKDAISEGGRIYTKLIQLGMHIKYFDVGGGLGVDYDGSKTKSQSSTNYSTHEYASDIVWGLKQICDLENVPHPTIVTESGRAVTAHHSCIITNVLGEIGPSVTSFDTSSAEGEHVIVKNIRELTDLLTTDNCQEIYSDAIQLKDEGLSAFKLGILSLEERAKIDGIHWEVLASIDKLIDKLEQVPEELATLKQKIAPKYLCNFSVFQSAADTWAINQLLPVLPITRLNERPTKECGIADITCDSDGKLDKFIGTGGPSSTVPLHELKGNQEYLIGLFLTGAYQDVMGDMHNLFGRLNEVHVFSDQEDPSGFYIEEVIKGNSAAHVLSTMQYNPEYMAQKIKRLINREVAKKNIPPREGVQLVDFYESCLGSYTYLS